MISIKNIPQLRKKIDRLKRQGKKVSFVPTMGALHEGHLSLVDAARREGDVLVASIFVNPAQFGPKEDYGKYPRCLNKDKELLKQHGVDILFCPEERDMYPEDYSTYVSELDLSKIMCGRSRRGHFTGVCTVVLKLFNIVSPDTAYVGQKDYQQALIIKRMVRDLNLPVKVKVMPTVREPDGLAMSSRNRYLTAKDRKKALLLYRSLLLRKPLKGFKLDYFVIADKDTLKLLKKPKKGALLAIAGKVGKTRLIDNVII